jgi:SAM-dependent methyltransferase
VEPPKITPRLVQGLPKAGPTDPIEFYRRPLVGHLFRRRINLGLGMLPDRIFERALEVGYGSGVVQLALANRAKELHGIDLDSDPDSIARVIEGRGVHANLRRGSVYELPYPDEHFELVVSFSVFEHLDDYPRALAEVARVLKPASYFLLGMPAVNLFMEAAFTAIGFKGIGDHHVTTPAQVASRFVDAGFRIVGDHHLYFPAKKPVGTKLYYNWLLTRVRTRR